MSRINFPRDDNGVVNTSLTPAVKSLATTYNASISSSVKVTLNAKTSLIEVGAIDKAVLLRWGASAASTTNFDEVIPANTVRQFYIPKGITDVCFIEQTTSAILTVIEK